jgi:phosphotransferase system enzyme I (PtsP)
MLRPLRRIIEEMESAESLAEALDILVQRTRQALETQSCSVFAVDIINHDYVLMATDGMHDKSLAGLRFKPHQGLIAIIGDQEKPLNLEDAPSHASYFRLPGKAEREFHAFLGVPIIYNRRLLGVLTVESKETRRFEEDEEAYLVTLGTQIAPFMARAETHEIISQQTAAEAHDDTVLLGIPSGKGVGIGQAVAIYPPADLDAVPDKTIEDIPAEIEILKIGVQRTRDIIADLGSRIASSLPEAEQNLFNAYLGLLDGDSIEKDIIEEIERGQWAQGALKIAIKRRVRQFQEMDDPYLRERASDIRDLGQRILARLQALDVQDIDYPERTILIGDELSATDLARVPPAKLAGIAMAKGSANSHVAILARALGVAAATGVANLPYGKLADTELIIDGYYGHVYIAPTPALRQEFLLLAEEEKELDASLNELRDLPAETPDGHRVSLFVNIGLDADASAALAVGSEGVGLFRSEVPFMTRDQFPSEEEQRVIYRQILTTFAPRPAIMRTLDVGGDKALPYFPIEEDNSFLGWRGIRISLDQPDLFLAQVRAMLRANRGLDNLKIMLPMISNVHEFDEAKALILEAHREVNTEEFTPLPDIGTMIEVPSAVYLSRTLARKADFLSIGSNDLTQYILAVDRNNPRVSGIYDSLHPAVLHALHQVVRAARLEGTPVGICGEMAGDPIVTAILVAMGFDSLSSSPANFARVKWVIRRFAYHQMRNILKEVMKFEDPADIRSYLEETLEYAGLGGLIRAGR